MQKKQGRRPWCSLHFAFLLAKKVIRLRTRCTFAAEISGSLGQTQWSKLDFFSETLQIWLQNTMIKIRLQIWLPQATNFLVLLVRVVVWVGAIQNDKIHFRTHCTFAGEISGSLGQTQWSKLDFFLKNLQIWPPSATNFLARLVWKVLWVDAIQNVKKDLRTHCTFAAEISGRLEHNQNWIFF